MEQIKRNLLTSYSTLLSTLLGLLDISSACKEAPLEYGSPHASYILKTLDEKEISIK